MNIKTCLSAAFCIVFAITPPVLARAENAMLDCMVLPEMYIEMSSPVDGVLEEVLVDKGDAVSKGGVLARLEASVETTRMALAKLESESTTEISLNRTELEFAVRIRDRIRSLATNNSVSRQEKDKAENKVLLSEIELNRALEKNKIAQLNLALTKAQLEQKTITSPIDGIVVERYAMVGESVNDRPIMKLAQVNPLRVELVAPTEYFGSIKTGMTVFVWPDRPAQSKFTATVTVVDQIIDPASGSFTVRLALPNPDEQLVSGVNCRAEFDFPAPDRFSGAFAG